jgi:type IV pilus assembly protein PilM
MAEIQSTIALNIGSQRVSMAVFDPTKSGGLVLKGYDSETILADPATESTRTAQIGLAVGELAKRLKVSRTRARYAVSGGSVFTRFVKLPPLDADDIEQLVKFEAQQHIPFPLEEVVWDYEVVESNGEKEVVIVAIKADALEELNETVNEHGLDTLEVDAAPMALFNAFRAAYPQVQEPVLLVDIGAKSSDLIYIEGQRFYTRSATTGGATVTAAISREFNISFAEAEAHKVSGGFISMGGAHTQELDEASAALSTSIRNAMTRLVTEIPRTTNHYRSQQGGNAPVRVFLAGGGANLPYTKEFFEEKLKLPVEYFNPLSVVSLGKSVNAEAVSRDAHLMGELVGLGLRGAGKTSVNIDLVPSKVQAYRDGEKRKPFLIGAAAVFLGGLAIWGLLNTLSAASATAKAESMTNTKLHLGEYADQIDGLLKKQATLVGVANQFSGLEKQRGYWFDLLSEVQAAFSSDAVWIVDIEPVSSYDPFAPKADKSGKSLIRNEFQATAYGQSSLDARESASSGKTTTKASAQKVDPDAAPTANAIRIKGFWRENPRSQTIVYDLLARLKEKPGHFKFVFPAPPPAKNAKVVKDAPKTVEVELIKQLESKLPEGEFAAPFEIVLPLVSEVPVK